MPTYKQLKAHLTMLQANELVIKWELKRGEITKKEAAKLRRRNAETRDSINDQIESTIDKGRE